MSDENRGTPTDELTPEQVKLVIKAIEEVEKEEAETQSSH